MQMSANRLNEVIRGKRGVTADTALPLAKLLKTTPKFWLNLQNSYDLYKAKQDMRRTMPRHSATRRMRP
jgi:addiction module HigA family antidote